MPTLTITKNYADGDILLESDLDDIRSDITTWANTTKLDYVNLQDDGVTPAKVKCDESTIDGTGVSLKVKDGGIDTTQIADDAVTTDKIIDGAITIDKMAPEAVNFVGEVKTFHSFNGTISIPRRWMQLNGDVVNETNYNAEHGAGSYAADGVADSDILSKNLPSMADKYIVGAASTTQDGTSAITSVGNTDHQVDLEHNHQWYSDTIGTSTASITVGDRSGSNDCNSYDNSGSLVPLTNDGSNFLYADFYTDNAGSTTEDIQPESVEFIYIMRVI